MDARKDFSNAVSPSGRVALDPAKSRDRDARAGAAAGAVAHAVAGADSGLRAADRGSRERPCGEGRGESRVDWRADRGGAAAIEPRARAGGVWGELRGGGRNFALEPRL